MDVVGESVNIVGIGVVVLHGDLYHHHVLHAFDINRFGEQDFLILVEVFDELLETALVVEHVFAFLSLALVLQGDAHAFVQESHFPEARLERVVFKHDTRVEHAVGIHVRADVGPEPDIGTRLLCLARHAQVIVNLAAVVLLLVYLAARTHFNAQVTGQGVDNGRADAVQAAGDFVSGAAKLAAGVQHGQTDLDRRAVELGMLVHREAAAVIADRHGSVGMDDDQDIVAIARQGFVDRVVHDLIDQVVQAARVRRTDIHARTLPHGFQALKHLDLRRVVGLSGDSRLDDFFRHVILHSSKLK